jgi:purine nucleosidase
VSDQRGKEERLVPELPPLNEKLRLLIDTDAANEIDDLYAISLALVSPDRFVIEGFNATHFAATEGAGPESIEESYHLLQELLEVSGFKGKYPVKKGAAPMQYYNHASEGEAVNFIIEQAHSGSADNPLWVLGLGAATNMASAILKDPSIIDKVRYVFHGRSEETWPVRSKQYNVKGDILAARALLASHVPLVWFDTGTCLNAAMEYTEEHIASTGPLGKYLHEFRYRRPLFMRSDKGFFDLGDVAWMILPDLCQSEIIGAPTMDPYMFYDHEHIHGNMVRVYGIDRERTWDLLEERLRRARQA